MTFKQSYLVNIVGIQAGMALLFIAEAADSSILGIIGAVIMLAACFQTYAFHRCPDCGHYVRPMIPEYRHCPHCGMELP